MNVVGMSACGKSASTTPPDIPTYLYFLLDPRDDSVRYVGITSDPARRLKFHRGSFRKRRLHRYQWIRKLKKLGLEPKMEIKYLFASRDRARVAEVRLIAVLKIQGARLVNMTRGGD